MAGIGAMLIALLVGTWVVFGGASPEARDATSPDGRVHVEGNAAVSLGALSVAVVEGDGPPSRIGPVYELALGDRAVPAGFDVVVSYDAAELGDLAPNRLSLYAFDRVSNAWIPVSSVVDPAARTVSATSTGIDAARWTLAAR